MTVQKSYKAYNLCRENKFADIVLAFISLEFHLDPYIISRFPRHY